MNPEQLWERFRSSLFYVPLLFGIGGAVLAQAMIVADERVTDLPDRLTATVDSARAILSVIAGATLTFAAIAFSVSLLLISAASSQYSPRVVHGLFRDPFNKRIMGIVVGTFIYCLVVMQSVHGPLEEAGAAVVPSISVLLALVLGVVAVLAIVAFINHSAHTMEVSTMLHRVTEDALAQVERTAPAVWNDDTEPVRPAGEGFVVTFERQGWVQYIDYGDVLNAIEPGACLELETSAGRYAIRGSPLCQLWPEPEDPERVTRSIRAAVAIGQSRTLQQDPNYGIRQLADVALKALSPGVNDPTTAQDALFHMASVVREILASPRYSRQHTEPDGRTLLAPETLTADETVGLAFDEVRIASAGQPTVQIYLLEILRVLIRSLQAADRTEALDALRRQADLVLEVSDRADLPEADLARVRSAHQKRFG